MKLLGLIALAAAIGSPSAGFSGEAPKIPVRDAIVLATALRNLDGHLAIVKQNGQEGTVMVPWEFGSGNLRQRITDDLIIAAQVELATDRTRQNILREIAKKAGAVKVDPGTPEFEEFQRQYNEVLDSPAAGTEKLERIKVSELKLDKNEIPITILAAMKPILDMDQ